MANTKADITLYHAPYSRSVSIRWLLEELGVPYRLQLTNIHDPSSVGDDYRAIQPNKKVPAVRVGSQVITERAAITAYLSDRFSEAGLAPTVDDPMRAPYLSMLVYVDAVFDPCVSAHHHGLMYKGSDYSFGAYDDLIAYLEKKLSAQPYAAGDRFTAADTQLGSALGYTMFALQAVPLLPVFTEYVARVTSRPAHARTERLDGALARKLRLPGSGPADDPTLPEDRGHALLSESGGILAP